MPLTQMGISTVSGNLDEEVRQLLEEVFGILDERIAAISRDKGLRPDQVRLLQPLHRCVFVDDPRILVLLSVRDIGAISVCNFQDWSGKPPLNLPKALLLVERDLQFRDAFGLELPRSILDSTGEHRETALVAAANRYLNDEIEHIERLNRIVRINHIFRGRDFLKDDKSVFVLSPFGEPFDTIYVDHIKPLVQDTGDLVCSRADDIYDNRPIIEDIWRCIHEARLLISELTDRNPNVFYETGMAHTVGKEVILITQSMEDVPFDLRHLRSIVYDYTPKGMKAF